jgi:hypothetical protein
VSPDHPLFDGAAAAPSPAAARPASQLPEPGRFSIRYTPRRRGRHRWPPAAGPWLDLATGRAHGLDEEGLGEEGLDEHADDSLALPALDAGEPLDDVVYLPPVPSALAAAREALAERLRERGTPVRVHRFPGEPGDAHEDDVFDLLPALLAGDLASLYSLPVGALVAWPLIHGFTDDPETWEASCQVLAEAGAAVVQGVVVDLSPADRRALLEREDEDLFDALFHAPPPHVRDLARIARRNGLGVFAPRPLPRPPTLPAARTENRRLAGRLALAAELSDRLERPPGVAQSLFRAAREADRTPYDLTALTREGNLGVLDWLRGEALDLVRATVAGEGRPGEGPLAPLLDAYAGPPVS